MTQRAITTADGIAAGFTYRQLRGPRFTPVHRRRGIWLPAGDRPSLRTLLAADRLALPTDAAISHRTGLYVYGIDIAPGARRHWTTATQSHPDQREIAIHRRATLGDVRTVDHLPVLSPERCLADIAPSVSINWLVGAGDALIDGELTSLDQIRRFAKRRIHGAKRLRIAASLMREGAESFRESTCRLIMHCASIPEPRLNVEMYDEHGVFVARNDFVWDRWRTVAEYDGWYHERDKLQRNDDLRRMDRVRELGWQDVILTSFDSDRPVHLSRLVWAKLARGGYAGSPPPFNADLWEELSRQPRRRSRPF